MRDLRHILLALAIATGLLGALAAGSAVAQNTARELIAIDVPVKPVRPVPEPAAMALFAVGAAITVYAVRRATRS